MLLPLNESSFCEKVFDFSLPDEQWLNKTKPCCVFLYADWCTYCRDMQPTVEQLAEKHKGVVDFYCINLDESKELSRRIKIYSVPALLFVPLNAEPQKLAGLFSARMIEFLANDIFKQN